MNLQQFSKPWQAIWRQRSELSPKVLILRYHRIAELPIDPYALSVTPHHFAQHLEVLSRNASVMRLRTLVRSLREGNHPDKGIVLTFDDGFADNLYHAKPLLERYEIPATVFVTTGYLEHPREFWFDELERVLLLPGTLPRILHLSINGNPFHWELEDTSRYSETDYRRNSSWNLKVDHDPTIRHRLFRRLHDVLKLAPHQEQWRILDALLVWSGLPSAVRSTHRPLAAEELGRLIQGGLVEIGAHSVTHPILSRLSQVLQREEIVQSKAYLEHRLGCLVTSFAYPYGDYSDETLLILAGAGFECACSTRRGRVPKNADPFKLPRIYIGDWSGDIFKRQLDTL